MLLDSDFTVLSQVSKASRYIGFQQVQFTSNIANIEGKQCAWALIISPEGLVERVRIVFDAKDIVFHSGTYYGAAWAGPAKVDKKGNRTAIRIKNSSFRIFATSNDVETYTTFNKYTGVHTSHDKYLINIDISKGLEKIDDLNIKLGERVKSNEPSAPIRREVSKFIGHHTIHTISNVYSAENKYMVNAEVDGVKIRLDISNFEVKIIPASRWQSWTIINPIINGVGTAMKDRLFEVDIISCDEFDLYKEEGNDISKRSFTTIQINPSTIKKIRMSRK